ncbi:serine hydrolase domain-containing protein, partial [Pseudomonas aeruginosa]|uniref:serine hydrolase domain-containing protein n=1 Tax=Pseudomonas aeruginosa TaxID=287 RepID=UPI002B4092F9
AEGNGPADSPQAAKRLLTTDTPVCLFSASKAVTAVLIHQLAEQGVIDLDQRVSHYVPKFGRAGKSETTIADVLAHRGGFPSMDVPKAQREV